MKQLASASFIFKSKLSLCSFVLGDIRGRKEQQHCNQPYMQQGMIGGLAWDWLLQSE